MYEAAALSYETVFDLYPDTPWAQQSLVGAMRTYIAFADQSVEARQVERLDAAVKNYERLTQIFRDSPYLKEAEGLYERAAARLESLQETDVSPAAAQTAPESTESNR